MKKSEWMVGLAYLVAGLACAGAALLTESRLEGLLWGFTGAGVGPGALMIFRYFYWSAPGNREQYRKRLEEEQIEQKDELKTKVRDRAGRLA